MSKFGSGKPSQEDEPYQYDEDGEYDAPPPFETESQRAARMARAQSRFFKKNPKAGRRENERQARRYTL